MATIQGTVADSEGTGIEDATVTARVSASDAKENETITDATGGYSMSVASDTYDVRAERIGYNPDEQETVVVSSGETVTVDLTLAALQPKVIGARTDVGIGVLGKTTVGSGTPIGVEGAVPNSSSGYGLSTPDDARVEGKLDTNETDFIVEAGSTGTSNALNVVIGHASNDASSGVVGATVGGGGSDSNGNVVANNYGTVAGGENNTAGKVGSSVDTNAYAAVGGGLDNTTNAMHCTGSSLEASPTPSKRSRRPSAGANRTPPAARPRPSAGES